MDGVNVICGSPVATTSGQSHLESAGCNNFRHVADRNGRSQQFPANPKRQRRVTTISGKCQKDFSGNNNFRAMAN